MWVSREVLQNLAMIDIPYVAMVRGYVDSKGSRSVTVDGSWVAVWVIIALPAAPLPIVPITRHRDGPRFIATPAPRPPARHPRDSGHRSCRSRSTGDS